MTDERTSLATGPTPTEASPMCGSPDGARLPASASSPPPSPARTSPPLAHELALMVLRAASGSSASGLSGSFFPAGWSWRTWPVVRATGSPTSGRGWRDSATRAYRSRLLQATQALRIEDDESSLSPTLTTARNFLSPYMLRWKAHRAFRRLLPTLTSQTYGSTNNGTRDGSAEYKTKGKPSLETMAKRGTLLPTLTASSATRGKACRGKNAQGGPSLQEAILSGASLTETMRLLPTLAARDSKGPGPTHTKSGVDLPQKVGGHLSPEFCEWFMGFPVGWTAPEPTPAGVSSGSATRSYRTKRKSSAGSSASSSTPKRSSD